MPFRGGPAGWGTVAALAVIAATLSAVNPGLLLVVPFVLLVLALPPHRALLTAAAVALGVLSAIGPRGGLVWYFERGWSLLVAGWFVLAVLLLPRARFLERGLLALVGAAATSLPFLWLNPGAFGRLEVALGSRLRDAAAQAATVWQKLSGTAGAGEQPVGGLVEAIYRAADLQVLLFPALLALASLAGLAVSWWGYRRLAAREREPLRPLGEFTFANDLVWALIAGIALLLLPAGAAALRVGANVLTFMAALYALRGVAVLVVVGGAPGPLGLVIGVLLLVFLYPLVLAAAVLVGVADTWLDLRTRRPPAAVG